MSIGFPPAIVHMSGNWTDIPQDASAIDFARQ